MRWVLAAALLALPAFAQPVPPELPPDVAREFERVQPLISEQKLTEALSAARKAHDLANAAHLEGAVRARLLDEIGSVQTMLGNYIDAEATYRRALELREQAGNLRDPVIAWTLNGLASALIAQGRTRDADAVTRRALALLDASFKPDDLTLMMALTNRMLVAVGLEYDDEFNVLQRRMADMTLQMTKDANPDAQLPSSDDPTAAIAAAASTFLDDPDLPPEGRLLSRVVNAAAAESNNPDFARTLLQKASQGAIDETGADSPASSCARIALAGSERLRGDLNAANKLYREAALRLAGRHEHQLDLAFAWLGIARVASAQHRPRDARAAYEKALPAMIEAVTENHPFVALILWELSSLDDAGFTAEKRAALAKRAHDLWDRVAPFREGRTMAAERVRTMLSGHQRLQEIYDCAGRLNTARMERDLLPGNRLQLATNLYQSGTSYFLYGAGSQGIPMLLRAIGFFREALGESHPYLLNVLRDLSYAEIQAKQIAAGLTHAREATALADARIGTISEPDEALHEQASQRAVYLNHLELLFEKGAEVAESFTVGQRARASSTALTLQASAARAAAGDPRIAALVREFQDGAAHLRKVDADLLTAVGRKPEERDLVTESRMRSERTVEEEALVQVRREIEQRAPAYAETVFPRPLPLNAAKALLQKDEALFALVSGPRFTFAWLVRHDSAAALRLPAQRRDWDEIVARFRRALDVVNVRRQSVKDPAHLAFDVKTGARIYRELLAPFERQLNGIRHLIIVPDGPLETVPFAALVTAPTPDTTPLAKIPWLIRRRALSVLPAVSSLRSLREQPQAQAPYPFAGFGSPLRSHVSLGSSDLDRMRALRQQSDLQETRAELATIGAAFGANESALHFGAEASEEAVKAFPLSMYRVVAFSTHASLGRGATEPSLLLAFSAPGDGRLTTSEIAELKLDADLVLLLGCDTAAADGTPDAEGFSGLTRAFLYAGTRAVFVSHWAIPSEETVVLSSAMFSGAESEPDIGLAEVLRRAMLTMINDTERPDLAHPVYWAPFVLVGDGNRPVSRRRARKKVMNAPRELHEIVE